MILVASNSKSLSYALELGVKAIRPFIAHFSAAGASSFFSHFVKTAYLLLVQRNFQFSFFVLLLLFSFFIAWIIFWIFSRRIWHSLKITQNSGEITTFQRAKMLTWKITHLMRLNTPQPLKTWTKQSFCPIEMIPTNQHHPL